MFDHLACARVREAVDAHADLAVLTALAALLRQVLSDRRGSSNAPLLSASILSRDQNRGEVHVIPDEVAARAAARSNKSTCSQKDRGRPAACRLGPGQRRRKRP
jgi:hypothetical protein